MAAELALSPSNQAVHALALDESLDAVAVLRAVRETVREARRG